MRMIMRVIMGMVTGMVTQWHPGQHTHVLRVYRCASHVLRVTVRNTCASACRVYGNI